MHSENILATAADAPRPQVSIVIPNHNYGRFLRACLQSVLDQGLNTRRIEVVFVDDASTDGSLDLARELLADMPLAGRRILPLPRTGRPGPVRNAGLAVARGQYLLTLDPDDALLPGFLPRSLEALASGADVAYTDYLIEERDGVREVRLGAYHKLLLANQNILPPTALFKRKLWDSGARFRSDTTYEDWDFWIQLALQRARFQHVGEPLYLYRMHGANYSYTARKADAESKARLVKDNAAFFPSWTLAWAESVLQGEEGVNPMERGIIPILPEHAARQLAL
ncbi:MAG: glycosyltransferase [Humidesulfovibrio sp.]|uniref:glycosyltransferase family 2 protein n=1 Tax=Humidesulfovibrio sp. TaxID=2910988 RepID=UPI00273710C1|nr:glycosyltransferase [Humidesulfovibrio sp.]MDP2846738.1 glycosyltransferase [Humidesulfovibrio sp.]